MNTHKDLDVWKKSIEFVTELYIVTKTFPEEEKYGLTNQLRRASISIPSNISEGAARKGKLEFKQFLYISLSNAAELETQLIIAKNLNFITNDSYTDLINKLNTISKMIQGLLKSLKV
ncbi:MAG: four helix bundle protein [Melioribacteraceae bacterium]